jgi:hypothetical protein
MFTTIIFTIILELGMVYVRPWIGRDRERREEEEEGGLARPGRRRELARDGRYSEI